MAGKKTEDNGKNTDVLPMELPQFYHEQVSYGMARDFVSINRKMRQCALLLETKAKDDASPEERMKVSVAQSEALDETGELLEKRDEFLDAIIKSIPRPWLVNSAPKSIAAGQWLDWIRNDRIVDLIASYSGETAKRREDSKN